jgi:hypothetical protein
MQTSSEIQYHTTLQRTNDLLLKVDLFVISLKIFLHLAVSYSSLKNKRR